MLSSTLFVFLYTSSLAIPPTNRRNSNSAKEDAPPLPVHNLYQTDVPLCPLSAEEVSRWKLFNRKIQFEDIPREWSIRPSSSPAVIHWSFCIMLRASLSSLSHLGIDGGVACCWLIIIISSVEFSILLHFSGPPPEWINLQGNTNAYLMTPFKDRLNIIMSVIKIVLLSGSTWWWIRIVGE